MNIATGTYYDAEQRIWSGCRKKDFYGPNMTLGEVALYILGRTPDKIVQIMDTTGEELTAADLIRQSKLLASRFMNLGLKPGDVVGISGNNTTYVTAVVIAAYLCGTPTHALYPGFDKESVALVFEVTRPKIIFCDVENYEVMLAAKSQLKLEAEIFILNGFIKNVRNVEELLSENGENIENIDFPCSKLSGDETAAILCSSGTTGVPKGARCSHRALLNMQIYPTLKSDSVLCTFSTLYWASGLWTLTAGILNGVKRIITDKPFTPEYFVALIEKYGITHLIAGPHQIAQVLQNASPDIGKQLTSVDTILCAGAKVPKVISEKMNAILGERSKVGLAAAYGMSELSSMLSLNDAGPGKRRDGTEGQLMPNTEVRIIDRSTGETLGPNEAGVVYIRTPYKWAGYFNNAVATEKATSNGWLVSGDIGYFDDEGFLHICTRDSDVFKSNNFQIYPEQIEGVIMQMSGVLEACVFGVPDFTATNLTACAIVRTDNEAGANLTAAEVIEHVQSNLAEIYHIKAGVYFMETLPKTGSGKVQRRKVLELLKSERGATAGHVPYNRSD